ncbi:hypothetical protein AAG570_004084 [Ranatra chinensis]|uniref:Uncharacterized protein n=1 Tax=Ranatra chinensis TaxID=642074 RepID=A0ABD0YKV6_9HEMI
MAQGTVRTAPTESLKELESVSPQELLLDEVYLPWSVVSRSEFVGPNLFRLVAIFSGSVLVVVHDSSDTNYGQDSAAEYCELPKPIRNNKPRTWYVDECKREGDRVWSCRKGGDCEDGSNINYSPCSSSGEPLFCCPPNRLARAIQTTKANMYCEAYMQRSCNDSDWENPEDVDEGTQRFIAGGLLVSAEEHPHMLVGRSHPLGTHPGGEYGKKGHNSTRRSRVQRLLSRRGGFKGWVEGDREDTPRVSFKFGVKGFEFFVKGSSDCGDIEVGVKSAV